VSLLTGASGLPHAEVVAGRESNPLGAASATPVVGTAGPVAYGTAYAVLVHLGGGDPDPAALPSVTTRADGPDLVAEVAWPGGVRDTVRLPEPSEAGTDAPRRNPHRA
jgi:hypothetical protein